MSKSPSNRTLTSQTKTVSRTTRVIIVQEISDTSSTAAAALELSSDLSPVAAEASNGATAAGGPRTDDECLQPLAITRLGEDAQFVNNDHFPSVRHIMPASACADLQVDRILSSLTACDVQHCDSSSVAADVVVGATPAAGRSPSPADGSGSFCSPSLSTPAAGVPLTFGSQQTQTTTKTTTTRKSCIEYVETTSCDRATSSGVIVVAPAAAPATEEGRSRDRSLSTAIDCASEDVTEQWKTSEGKSRAVVSSDVIDGLSPSEKFQSDIDGDRKSATAAAETRLVQTISQLVEEKTIEDRETSVTRTTGGVGLPMDATGVGVTVADQHSKTTKMKASIAKATQRHHALKKFHSSLARRNVIGALQDGSGVLDVSVIAAANSGGRTAKILHHGVDDLVLIEDSLTYRILRPVIVCMMIVGLYYSRRGPAVHHANSGLSRVVESLKCRSFRQQIYCLLVMLVLLMNFVWSLTVFDVSTSQNLHGLATVCTTVHI